MKKILALLLIIPCFLHGQTSYNIGIGFESIGASERPDTSSTYITYSCHSVYDTSIVFKGVDTILHEHKWTTKSNITHNNMIGSCAVIHGVGGCPNYWVNENSICTICLKSINVVENKIIDKQVHENTYNVTKKKLDKILAENDQTSHTIWVGYRTGVKTNSETEEIIIK